MLENRCKSPHEIVEELELPVRAETLQQALKARGISMDEIPVDVLPYYEVVVGRSIFGREPFRQWSRALIKMQSIGSQEPLRVRENCFCINLVVNIATHMIVTTECSVLSKEVVN